MREDTKVIIDETTIYEVDLNCYHCLSEQDRRKYFSQASQRYEDRASSNQKKYPVQ